MKNILKNIVTLSVVLIAFAFTTIDADKKVIKVESSSVVWKSYKINGSHKGTINIKSGHLNFDNKKLTGGEFIMDMPTISCTDLEGEYKGKLEGHLKSDDFFGIEKFPTATLVFKKIKISGKNSYEILGDITIKGKTAPITFDLSIYDNKANASLKVDRTKFGIKYGSASFFDNLKDKAIYDEFDLIADLEF